MKDAAIVVALVANAIAMIVGFGKILIAIGEIKQQLALLWAWYLSEVGPGIPGGRRRTDPPASFAGLERRLEAPRPE